MPRPPRGRQAPSVTRSDERFRKSDRLLKRPEFLAVQRGGKKVHLRDMLVIARGGTRRMGVTVTKKVGNAVQRNRIKRLVREVWRRRRVKMPEGLELVFVAKKSAVRMTFDQLRRQFDELETKLSRGRSSSQPGR